MPLRSTNLGKIIIWEYLKKCSYLLASYEPRQRNWALGVGRNKPNNVIIENSGEEIQNNEPEEINNQPPPHDPNRPNPLIYMTTMTIDETPDKYIDLPCGTLGFVEFVSNNSNSIKLPYVSLFKCNLSTYVHCISSIGICTQMYKTMTILALKYNE